MNKFPATVISQSLKETKKIAADFLAAVKDQSSAPRAMVIGLSGELGAGKTAFTQAIATSLGIKERVLSPTFIIMRRYAINPPYGNFVFLYHWDCYRLEQATEITALGWPAILDDPANIVIVEWPEKIQALWPAGYWRVRFKVLSPKKREMNFEYFS